MLPCDTGYQPVLTIHVAWHGLVGRVTRNHFQPRPQKPCNFQRRCALARSRDTANVLQSMTQTLSQPPAAPPILDYEPAHGNRDATIGLLYGIAAYSFWGIVAEYFKLLAHVPPMVVLSNRIAWSTLFLLIV